MYILKQPSMFLCLFIGNWVELNGIEYMVQGITPSLRKTYEEALVYCENEGGKLAEPKSAAANNDIATLASNSISDSFIGVWIGSDDKSQEGYFRYASDDTSITYTDWDTAQPDNGIWYNGNLEEDCVKLWKWPYANRFKWSDGLCSVKQSFVCERIQGK